MNKTANMLSYENGVRQNPAGFFRSVPLLCAYSILSASERSGFSGEVLPHRSRPTTQYLDYKALSDSEKF